VVAAGQRESAEALARLCKDYWPPLYAFIRRSGYSVHEAEDLTQEFFARLLDKNYLQDADRERGRFRSFLLAALTHFLANRRKAARAQKRGGGKAILSFDFQAVEAGFQSVPADERTPELLFDQQWALLILDRVLRRLEAEQVDAGKGQQFRSLLPCITATGRQAYSEVANELATSESAVKMAVHRLRKRYRQLLRNEIANTVARPEEIDEELQELFAVLAKK
jgi:RNA polymerase sigma factor (sigma-70 family)